MVLNWRLEGENWLARILWKQLTTPGRWDQSVRLKDGIVGAVPGLSPLSSMTAGLLVRENALVLGSTIGESG